ncbi:nucleotide cyclase [Penicillium longicatenatum]|uniref:nucleotide cyclase n=1 Tax=Penicillium longicatenatum TaxID=1561947 RepID=UPI0025488333|nr:nucleotide cyclase [Penicillium longicatenatum]KAJ5651608.1 nucleotide cyclase [Penicillium longicatenatum]
MGDLYKTAINIATIFSETDSTGTILNISDLFCRVSGYARQELIGQNHRLIRSQHHPTAFYCGIWNTIAKGSVWRGQICNKANDGALYWLYCTIIPVLAPDASCCDDDQQRMEGHNKDSLLVQKYISVSFDITSQIEMIERLQFQSSYDSLTGLPNRNLLVEHLMKRTCSTQGLHKSPFAIGMLDMDRFKLVNDTYGHVAGDKVLIETATRLRQLSRQEDIVARLGGDEFVIVWDDDNVIMNSASVLHRIEHDEMEGNSLGVILDRVFAQPYSLDDGILLENVRGSLGIALYPDHGLDFQTLLKHADQAMYQAKYRGDRVCVFNWELDSKTTD